MKVIVSSWRLVTALSFSSLGSWGKAVENFWDKQELLLASVLSLEVMSDSAAPWL